LVCGRCAICGHGAYRVPHCSAACLPLCALTLNSRAGRPGSIGQHAPASRGWLCLPLAGESLGEPLPARPSAYPGGPGARPPTLASRGEAALYRRAAQEQPRYTQHVPSQAGQGREGGEAAGAPRPWGPAPAAPAPASSQPQQPAKLPGGDTRQATVHFCCHYRAEYGQRLRLVGSHANLGARKYPPLRLARLLSADKRV